MRSLQPYCLLIGKIKKDIHLLSTCVSDGAVIVTRTGKGKEIPLVVNRYNKKMGGVDRSDQMMTSYQVERKRGNGTRSNLCI